MRFLAKASPSRQEAFMDEVSHMCELMRKFLVAKGDQYKRQYTSRLADISLLRISL